MFLDRVFARFLSQSIGLFGLNLFLTAFGHEVLKLSENHAFLVSQILVFLVGFQLARRFAFQKTSGAVSTQLGRTLAVSLFSRAMEYIGYATVNAYTDWNYLLLIPLVQGPSLCLKYLLLRYWAFR